MMRLIRYISIVFLTLSLTGCFAGRVDDGNGVGPVVNTRGGDVFNWKNFYAQEKSDFYIDSLDAIARSPENSIEDETAIDTHVLVVYNVRIKSRGTNQILINQNFRTVDPITKEIHHWSTDDKGMGSWSETIEFDATQPQRDPILMKKRIDGTSNGVRGSTHAVFELNPWAAIGKGDYVFRDLTYQESQLQELYGNYDPSFNVHKFFQDPSSYRGDEKASVFISRAQFFINRSEEVVLDSTVGEKLVNTYEVKVPSSANLSPEGRLKLGVDQFYFRGNAQKQIPRPNYVSLDVAKQIQFFNRQNQKYENAEDGKPIGMRLRLNVNLDLQRRYFLKGKPDYEDITNGKFMVFAALVGSNQGLTDPILLGMSSTGFNGGKAAGDGTIVSTVPEVVNGNRLSAELDMYTPYLLNRGDIDLAIKVVPMGRWAARNLKPFGIVYKIGDYSKLAGHSGGFVVPQSDRREFDYDTYVRRVENMTEQNKELLLKNGFLREADELLFSNMNIKFKTVKAGETSTQRTVIFSVTTCPTDGFTGVPVAEGRQFKVLVSGSDPLTGETFERVPLSQIRNDGSGEFIAVQDNNCLSWIDEIAHKYYQRENLIDRTYHVIAGDKEYDLPGYFNPWDEKFGTLGVDARTLSEQFINEIRSRSKLPSRFFVGDYSYHTLRFRYNIDNDMNMTVKKTVLFSLYPFVKRYSNIINGINGNFPLRDGVYLLKLAYHKDYIDPAASGVELHPGKGEGQVKVLIRDNGGEGKNLDEIPYFVDDPRRKTFIHTVKKLVRVENNRVITPVEFEIEDLRTLRIRSNMLLQIEPVNQYKLQIVNLFQRLIADKLALRIGDLGRFHCVDPKYRMAVLTAFQKTLDDIAKAIPDDINYNSTEKFKEVINSDGVREALSTLTENDLLEGIASVLESDLDQDQINEAFAKLTPGDLTEIEKEVDLEAALEKREKERLDLLAAAGERVAIQNKTVLAVLDGIADKVATAAPMSLDKDYTEHLVPFDSITGTEEDGARLTNPAKPFLPGFRSAVDGLAKYSKHFNEGEKARNRLLSELTTDENLNVLLNNDFTIDPSVSLVSDLDYLIDRKAGIIRRTFIGPLTLVNMDNKNSMNATDALDYNSSNSVNQDGAEQNVIANYSDSFSAEYDQSPYFGFQGQFENCHVDDFIVNERELMGANETEEQILYRGWSECAQNHFNASETENLELRLGVGYHCDYTATRAYSEFPEVFKKYLRLDDEKNIDGSARQCLYRDVWLQKYFAQKKRKQSDKLLSNFLAHSENTAKLVVTEQNPAKRIDVGMLTLECLEKGILTDECFTTTKNFDRSVEDMVDEYLEYKLNANHTYANQNEVPSSNWWFQPTRARHIDIRDDEPAKNVLEEFYRENIDELVRPDADIDKQKFATSIYNTLIKLAAPTVEDIPEPHEPGLRMALPADFGPDVQNFFCNLLLPRLDRVHKQYLEHGKPYTDGRRKISPTYVKNRMGLLMKECFSYAEAKHSDLPLPFNIQRIFRTIKTGRYFFRGGKSINFNVNQSVSVGHNNSWQNSYGVEPFSPVKDMIKAIPKAGGVLGSALGVAKLPSYTVSESNSKSDGKSLTTGTHLSMQAAQLDVELKKYRRCLLVRWNPKFLERMVEGERMPFPTLITKVLPAESNIFICGDVESEPIAIRENYYYLTQHFTEGDLLDNGSLLNNPWLLSLRGYRDMIGFVTTLYPVSEAEDLTSLKGLMWDDFDKVTSKRDFFVSPALDPSSKRVTFGSELEAWQMMAETYKQVSPAFPGTFIQLTNKELTLPDWPWSQESRTSQINQAEERTCQ